MKRLDGDPGKRGINPREAKPDTTAPRCPTHIKGEARKEWKRIVPLLHAAGLLTAIDRNAIEAHCECYARWIEAETQLKKTGLVVKAPSGYPMQSPYLAVANTAMKQMRGWLAEFGMTPAARTRITAEPPEQDAGPSVLVFHPAESA
ncbi:MAG: phage terminase small subunit P27 family [Planctomycetota bacterium]